MPTYNYVCSVCGKREDQVRRMADMDAVRPCPHCPRTAPGGPPEACNALKVGVMVRDVAESMRVHTDTGYSTPIYSDSAGIEPSAVPEMRKRFPHHEYTDDGTMVFRSHQQRERCLKDIGMVDKGKRGWN